MQLEEIQTILRNQKEFLHRTYDVKALGIFGSVVRNEQTRQSDVDILVEFEHPIGFRFVDLADYLERILHTKVDLVSKAALKPKMLDSVSQDILYVLT